MIILFFTFLFIINNKHMLVKRYVEDLNLWFHRILAFEASAITKLSEHTNRGEGNTPQTWHLIKELLAGLEPAFSAYEADVLTN